MSARTVWRTKVNKRCFVITTLAVLGVSVVSNNALAVSDETREDEFGAAEVRYYEPSSCSLNDSLNSGSIDSASTQGLSTIQSNWIDRWRETAQQLSIEFGIPWEAAMAQSIIESGAGTSHYARMRNNFFGLGAVDGDPDNAFSYPTPEAGWRGYFEYIQQNSSRYSAHGVFAEPAVTDPYAYLDAIKEAGYASSDTYVESVSNFIDLIIERSEQLGWDSLVDLAKAHPEMLENAKKNRVGSDNSERRESFLGDGCSCGGDTGASGIRWDNGYVVSGSVSDLTRADVLNADAESRISSLGYGLSFTTKGLDGDSNGPNKIILKTIAPNNNSGDVVDDSLSLYRDGNFPHFTIDIRNQKLYQHFSTRQSAAALGRHNRDGGIVVAVIGYVDDSQSSSPWYLFNSENVSDVGWAYLENLLKAIHEEYAIPLKVDDDWQSLNAFSDDEFSKLEPGLYANEIVPGNDGSRTAGIWDVIASGLENAKDHGAKKCGNNSELEANLSSNEIDNIIRHYNSSAVMVAEWNLPSGRKTNSVSFVAYFAQRFTNVGKVARTWGNGRDTAAFFANDYPQFGTGTEPKPLAIFSTTNGTTMCGAIKCGHTGIVVSVENGQIKTIEAAYPSTSAHVVTRSLDYFENTAYSHQFTYLSSDMNEAEFELGKQGR